MSRQQTDQLADRRPFFKGPFRVMQGVKKRKIVTTLQKEKNITMEAKDQKVIKEMKSVGWKRERAVYIYCNSTGCNTMMLMLTWYILGVYGKWWVPRPCHWFYLPLV